MTSRRSFLQLVGLAPLGYPLLRIASTMKTLYVGTYTDGNSGGIYRCRMNSRTGALEIVEITGASPTRLFWRCTRPEHFCTP